MSSDRAEARSAAHAWANRIGNGSNRHLAAPFPMRSFLLIQHNCFLTICLYHC